MNTHYLTNEIAVDPAREVKLNDNGKTGDARVTMCCAPAVLGASGWLFYLETNGDPVLLTDDAEEVAAWIETSGLTMSQIMREIDASPADLESKRWAAGMVEFPIMNEDEDDTPMMTEDEDDTPDDAAKHARWEATQNEAAKEQGYRCLDHALEATDSPKARVER